MNSIVVDASIAATWLLPDEWSQATDHVLRDLAGTTAIVPSLFRYEVRNIVLVAFRRGRIDAARAKLLMKRLDGLPLADGGHGDDAEVLSPAVAHGLTAYDAVYLAMAKATGSGLATLDKKLAAAARRERVALVGPLAP